MKTSEFLELSPREQDAIVAEKILGFEVNLVRDEWLETRETAEAVTVYALNFYTRSIAAAWEVVEKLADKKYLFSIELSNYAVGEWVASFSGHDSVTERAFTPALAICLAALKAVGFLE